MYMEFVINYKLFSMPWFYTFTVYAESGSQAISEFLKEYPIGVEKYYISKVYNI